MKSTPRDSRRPPGAPWLWLVAAIAVVLGVALVVVAVTGGDDSEAAGEPVAVPDVVGLSEEEAVSRIDAAGLDADRQLVAADTGAGTVVEQDPDPGAEAAAGSTVLLRIAGETGETETVVVIETETTETEAAPEADPPPTVVVPDVVGLGHVQAGQTVEDGGLIPDTSPVESSVPRGQVVAQSPAPGQEVANTRHVTLEVSAGPGDRPLERIPDVTGPKASEARAIARQSGFTVRTVDRDAPTAEEVDEVILQRPEAGSEQPALTQITLYVGR